MKYQYQYIIRFFWTKQYTVIGFKNGNLAIFCSSVSSRIYNSRWSSVIIPIIMEVINHQNPYQMAIFTKNLYLSPKISFCGTSSLIKTYGIRWIYRPSQDSGGSWEGGTQHPRNTQHPNGIPHPKKIIYGNWNWLPGYPPWKITFSPLKKKMETEDDPASFWVFGLKASSCDHGQHDQRGWNGGYEKTKRTPQTTIRPEDLGKGEFWDPD